jgi:glycerate kinase
MRVLVAPDSFKGSIAADEAAHAIAAGWLRRRPDDEVGVLPLADGGEGTLAAFRAAFPDSVTHELPVTGPDGRIVASSWLEVIEASGSTGVIEFASTSGITMLGSPAPLDAHSAGFGEAITDALDRGCRRLLLTLGGSGSSDGGQGLLAALGARFLDAAGEPVGLGNRFLSRIASVDISGLRTLPPGVEAVVLSDVTNPLLGERGAVAVFGAQKGITAELAPAAEQSLRHFSEVLRSVLGGDPDADGAGAAGGAGFALGAWGARMQSGAEAIGELTGLASAISRVSLVVTGEGRYDDQSEGGKATGHVRALAAAHGVPCALVAGQISGGEGLFACRLSLTELAGSTDSALEDPARWLDEAGSRLADEFGAT